MGKQVYLIRHGIAIDRALSEKDETRTLTEKGRKKTEKVAKRLKEIGINFEIILTSPLLRATQTAEILKAEGLTKTLETFPPLAPNGNIEDWLNWWEENTTETVALVGHEPNLGNWSELLIWGEIKGKLVVKKAGIIGLNCPENLSPFANSELFLFTSPKWLLSQ